MTDAYFGEIQSFPVCRSRAGASRQPSIASWPEGRAYLDQQRRRLPTHKFRRLHLNLPGSPNGAFLDQGAVLAAIVAGRKVLPREGHKVLRVCRYERWLKR